MWLLLCGGLSLGACLRATTLTAATTPARRSASRDDFLKRLDAAFASRDAKRVSSLGDLQAWSAAGYPGLAALQLFLPPRPLRRERVLSETEVLYQDGKGKRWKASLREDPELGLKAVIRPSPCPRAVSKNPRFDSERSQPPATQGWTLLECWPLPR